MVSCSKEEVIETNSTESVVKILAHIESDNTLSRAKVGIDGKGNFEEGDVITLALAEKKVDLTLNGGDWTPSLKWNEIETPATFVGFYPTVPMGTNNVFTHTVLTNQNENKNFEMSDLLCATTSGVQKSEEVQLNFKHLMSCITIELKSNQYTAKQLELATVKVRAYNQVKVDMSGQLMHTIDHAHGYKGNIPVITMHHKGDGIFQAIVCPHYFRDMAFGGVDSWLEVIIDGKPYSKQEPPTTLYDGTPFNEYKSGENVRFTFSINEKKPNPEIGGKTLWVYGLENIPPVEDPAWTAVEGTKLKQLVWKKGDNWYDCDKKDSSNPTFDDHRLCWAASASNMIHWWLDRNSDLIGKYCNDKKVPRTYTNHLESEVFDVFKKSFTDEGSYIEKGLNWYFLQKYGNDPGAASITDRTTGGYFKEVFKELPSMAEKRGISTLDDFSAILKNAFQNQMAIGFNIYMAGLNNGGRHAMTLWGAKFDTHGKVCEIYYCDNNDGGDISEKPHLIAAKVKDSNGVRLQGANINGSFTIKIEDVVLLGLKRAELEKYFNQ